MIYRENRDEPAPCIGCGEENYVAHDVSLCAACKQVCQNEKRQDFLNDPRQFLLSLRTGELMDLIGLAREEWTWRKVPDPSKRAEYVKRCWQEYDKGVELARRQQIYAPLSPIPNRPSLIPEPLEDLNMSDDDLMKAPRHMLTVVNELIEEHMSGDNSLNNDTLDWALHIQRASRLYLYQLGAPEAPSYWGKWRQNNMRTTWGNVKA